MKINKVLIANRGEIAVRIMQTLRRMNVKSVALYTEMEKDDLHVQRADEAFLLGSGLLQDTWLNISAIIEIAKQQQVDAIHPGYGFLSENAAFARACEKAGIIFIGPQSHVIKSMGNKTLSAHYARKAGIPLLPRMEGNVDELVSQGAKLGFPLLVKAESGGGGKGMIKVESEAELRQAVYNASQQAKRYFADDKVYLEKYVESPRHIEVQILADHHGNVIHLLERECTLQRSHQKVIEEAPSVSLHAENRAAIHAAAVNLACETQYRSAGTVEFILDNRDGKFYFLEMNTRIQVEHPVTEMVTGIDIVEEQINIAMNRELSLNQQDVIANGHAIEARLYAEDPAENFRPSAGFIQKIFFPQESGLRVDTGIEHSGYMHTGFDAMIAKVIVHESHREKAILKLDQNLEKILIHGIKTNIDLLINIAKSHQYGSNQIHTQSILANISDWKTREQDQTHMYYAAALLLWTKRYRAQKASAWRAAGWEKVVVNNRQWQVFYYPKGNNGIRIEVDGEKVDVENIRVIDEKIEFLCNNNMYSFVFSNSGCNAMFLADGIHYDTSLPGSVPAPKVNSKGEMEKMQDLKATLFGRVLQINVAERQKVNLGDPLLVLESMKMENTITAPADRTILKVNVKEGDQVSDGQILLSFET